MWQKATAKMIENAVVCATPDAVGSVVAVSQPPRMPRSASAPAFLRLKHAYGESGKRHFVHPAARRIDLLDALGQAVVQTDPNMYVTLNGSATRCPPEIAVTALPDDERVWVPQAEGVWFRPLMLNTLQVQWSICCASAAPASSASTSIPDPSSLCHQGRWHYLEHDSVAETSSYVFEPPGEIHTLTVPEDCEEIITFFNISGSWSTRRRQPPDRLQTFSPDRHGRKHYISAGLGADFVEQFVR